MQMTQDLHEHSHDHRNELLMLWLKAALLLGLGAYFVYNIVSGNLTNYINYRFAWLSYVAVAIFLLLGIYSTWVAFRASREHALHDAHDHADHQHAGISWSSLAVLAIPLALGVLIPSTPLGASAINGDLSTTAAIGNVTTTTFTTNPLDRNVLDWLRYFGSLDDMSEANGQPADMVGFVYKEPTFGADQFMIARFTISCCVADASAIGVPAFYAGTADLEQGVWVRVQGTFQAGDFRDDTMPILQVASIDVIDQPDHPYLYP